jgi:hypothetical protein
VDVITIPIVIQQTQPVIQGVWSNILIMGTVEQPPIQQSILITTPQPIVEIALTCAYCQ